MIQTSNVYRYYKAIRTTTTKKTNRRTVKMYQQASQRRNHSSQDVFEKKMAYKNSNSKEISYF